VRCGLTLGGAKTSVLPGGSRRRQPEAPPEPEPTKEPTFGEVVGRYFAEYAPSALSPSTVDSHRSVLGLRFVPHLGELLVTEASCAEERGEVRR
jgi:hypothetical protein